MMSGWQPILEEHALSPWLDQANDYLLMPIRLGRFEALPVRSLPDGTSVLMCVPFSAYDLDKGDTVRKTADDGLQEVVRRSGDCGFRFRAAPHARMTEIIKALQEAGCEIEFAPRGSLVAVNAPSGTDQGRISGFLADLEDSGELLYETVRLKDR